jgi:hypothetical protein
MGGVTSIGGPPMMLFVSIHADEIDLVTWRGSNAVLRLLLNLARAAVFIRTGHFDLTKSWPLDVGMVCGAWLGLVSGNACAHFFRDANSLHWWMVSFLFYASLLMAAAGAGEKVQREASIAVGCMAAATAFSAAIRQVYVSTAGQLREPPTELHQPFIDDALDAADADPDDRPIYSNGTADGRGDGGDRGKVGAATVSGEGRAGGQQQQQPEEEALPIRTV